MLAAVTLPRNKSRAIRVDGTRYRWLVSRVDPEFSMLLRIEQEEGQGQSLVVRQGDVHSINRVPPIVPRYVAAAIRHARALGWRPEVPGRDLVIDAAKLGRPRRLESTDLPAPGTTALWSRVDFDPLRVSYPWAHHDPGLFLDFRLTAEPSDKVLGSLFAHLARKYEVPHGSRPGLVLEALCHAKDSRWADDARSFYIAGGIEVIVEGQHVLWHGCCVTIDEWVQWRELLRTGKAPWNGHDPFSTAALEGDRVVFHDPPHDPSPPASVSRERYEGMLDALEQDLRGFVRAAEAWASARASAAVGRTLSERLAASMGLDG